MLDTMQLNLRMLSEAFSPKHRNTFLKIAMKYFKIKNII